MNARPAQEGGGLEGGEVVSQTGHEGVACESKNPQQGEGLFTAGKKSFSLDCGLGQQSTGKGGDDVAEKQWPLARRELGGWGGGEKIRQSEGKKRGKDARTGRRNISVRETLCSEGGGGNMQGEGKT